MLCLRNFDYEASAQASASFSSAVTLSISFQGGLYACLWGVVICNNCATF